MDDFIIIRNGGYEGTYSAKKIIYYKCNLSNFCIDNSKVFEECIFIECHLKSLKLMNINQFIKISFLNCRISNLLVSNLYNSNIQFFNSIILESNFRYSTLSGVLFSNKISADLLCINDELKRKESTRTYEISSSNYKELDFLSIHRSEFLFCKLNDLWIDNTVFTDTAIKHCEIQNLKIVEDVEMRQIDFRGSSFFGSDFEDCRFGSVKFNKSKYFVEIINFLLQCVLIALLSLKYIRYGKGEKLSRILFRKVSEIRSAVKKVLYKIKLSTIADRLSSTSLVNVQYGETRFDQDIRFYWHMDNAEFIENLKKKHPFFSTIMLFSSNNLRSFFVPVFFIFAIIFIFSLFYSSYGIFVVDESSFHAQLLDPCGHPKDSLHLSAQIFLNGGISPLETIDSRTRVLIIIEILLSYFFLGTLFGVIINNFLIKPPMPRRWRLGNPN